jgi:hypothetical protein
MFFRLPVRQKTSVLKLNEYNKKFKTIIGQANQLIG